VNLAETRAIERDAATQEFVAIERLLHKLAIKMLPRALSVEPTVQHEDLFSIFSEVYVNCKARFDATRKVKFSTYLQNSCYYEFNEWMGKREKERLVVGPNSIESIAARSLGGELEGEHGFSNLDRRSFMEDETEDDPCEVVSRKQQILAELENLSPKTRKVVNLLLRPSPEVQDAAKRAGQDPGDIRIKFVVDFLGLSRKEKALVRTELKEIYDVDFKGLPK
jgi:hypothetical protein